MFESARVKLTLFYLAILLVFSLLLTVGLRAFALSEINHANEVQRSAVHSIGQQFIDELQGPAPANPDRMFARIQRSQNTQTLHRLTRETILLNVGVLVVGGALSYWYAGKTLRPIQEAHERQQRFTVDASHELRTPLAAMKVENEVFLRQKSFDQAEARAQVTSNLEEVDRLERLATNLLDLNRYEHTVLKKQKLALHDVIDEAIKRTTYLEAAKHTTFQNTTDTVDVLGDSESLTQMICILLDNAIKYGPTAGLVEISSTLTAHGQLVVVRDHGKGISETDLPHIFDRMYRGDKARGNAISGHGIGLSLALEIAQANGASLRAGNHPDGGAQFFVTIPKA